MQRNILICRHAATHDPFPLQPDFERELTPDGIKQAHTTGQWIRENFIKTDAILASPSRRTSATARIVASRLYFAEERIDYNPDLYNARESQLLNCLGKLSDTVKTVLLVAHNPGVTRLARELTEQLVGYLDPAAVVVVSLDLEKWEDIHTTTGKIGKYHMEQV